MEDMERLLIEQKVKQLIADLKPTAFLIAVSFNGQTYQLGEGREYELAQIISTQMNVLADSMKAHALLEEKNHHGNQRESDSGSGKEILA